jgi:activator of HSP90 ATPase
MVIRDAVGTSAEFEEINSKEKFKCTGQELFNALTQKEMLQIFTASSVSMKEAKPGAEFELLNGNILGEFVEVAPYSKLVMKWRLKSWPSAHFSTVCIDIEQNKEDTTIKLKQTGVPKKYVEATKQGWKVYYWEAIRRSFGFGSAIF